MTESYYDKAVGNTLMDLTEDVEFQKDMLRFFSSDRYGMSKEELSAMTPADLTNEFVEHMRWQEVNEATVWKDYNFVNRAKEQGDQRTLDSFGRLLMAWDNAEGGGTGKLAGAGDYIRATLQSPSTAVTVATAGLGGPVAKIAGAAGKKGAQIGLRKLLTDTFTKQVAGKAVMNEAAKKAAKESLKTAAIKGFGRGASIEAATEGAFTYGQERIREEVIEDKEVDWKKVATQAAISGGIGGSIGALARTYSINKQNKVIDELAKKGFEIKKADVTALKNANARLKKTLAPTKKKNPEAAALTKRAEELISVMSAKQEGTGKAIKKALSQVNVAQGQDLAARALSSTTDEAITTGLSTNTLRKVSAASLDIADKLGFKISDDVRISERVSEGLANGKITSTDLQDIMKSYNLSKSEFGLVFLSEMSEAGRKLNVASQLSKAVEKKSLKADLNSFVSRLEDFTDKGIISVDDESINKFAYSLTLMAEGKDWAQALREIDAARIGIMVSQPATTARNVTTSIGRTAVDASDRMFLNVLEGRNPFSQVMSTIKGATWGKDEAMALRLLTELDPESDLSKIFHAYTRVENDIQSTSLLSRTVNTLNTLNTVTDTQFKQMSFYSSIQRSLSDMKGQGGLPKTVREFLDSGKTLEDLPKGILDKARREALSMTFQRGYEDAVGLSGKAARTLITANYKYPFVISAGVGIPFPRYVANQMEFIHKYGPTGVLENAFRVAKGEASKDVLESNKEAISKTLTGSFILGSALALRMAAGPETQYNELLDEAGNVVDIGPSSGPYQASLLLGDMIARYSRGEEVVPKVSVTAAEATEILSGLNTFGYGGNSFTAIIDSIEQGFDTEQVQKYFGDIVATFTLPAAPIRDVVAQFDKDAMTTPYTRNIDPENLGSLGAFKMRATRFLPDFSWVQYSSSFNGRNDVPLYSGFNEEPVQRVNPLSNQMFGMPISVKRNSLQNEMVKHQLKEYVMLGSRRIQNPNTDYPVREILSKTLPTLYEEEFLTNNFSLDGNTKRLYEDLPPEQQKVELQKFITETISAVTEDVENKWQMFASKNPKAASGWIMNNYALKAKQYSKELGSLDRIVHTLGTKEGGGRYESVDEYLDDADTVVDRLTRMQSVLFQAERFIEHDKEARK